MVSLNLEHALIRLIVALKAVHSTPSLAERMGSLEFALRLTNFSNSSFVANINKNRRKMPSQTIQNSSEFNPNKKNTRGTVTTRPYRAPEVILGLALTPMIDVYSAGCVVYELHCRKLLFNPLGSQNYSKDEDHLAQIMELRVNDQEIARSDSEFLKTSPKFSVKFSVWLFKLELL